MPPQMTRLMYIFGLLIALYVVVRWVAKPESFYWYGHYRGAALAEIAGLEIEHSPPGACSDCHSDKAAENRAGPHSSISCQTCHGAGEGHVNEPTAANIALPVVSETCVLCHERNHARPDWFPQVKSRAHSSGMACDECHLVHNPGEFQ